MTDLTLAAEFPALTRADWLKRVEAVLKGSAFEEKLVTSTADGIRLEPLYEQLPGPRAARTQQTPWDIFQRVDHPEAGKANAQALDDLGNGASGLVLVCNDSRGARGFGVDPANLGRVVQDVQLHAMALRMEGSASLALADIIAGHPVDPERMNVSFAVSEPGEALDLAARGFNGPFMEVDGRSWHESGASEAQELGAVLAEAVAGMRKLEGLDDARLARAIGITLAADQDMFATLAKFRAMRLLWRRVLEAAGLAGTALKLHAESSWRMMAERDPHTNILRATAAVFGAGLGGADSICVLPFSLRQGLPNAFARRVARNVQTVLIEEADLWRVVDPASGAGYVEHLTHGLCEAAWAVFQKAEAGGWPRPDSSSPRGMPVIGTSAYRLPTEYPAEVEAQA